MVPADPGARSGFLDRVAALRRLHVSLGLRITDEVEKPAQERETVSSAEAEVCCALRELLGEGRGVVVSVSDGVDDDLCDGGRILTIAEEIRRDARRDRHR
jgi:hypothetical protein